MGRYVKNRELRSGSYSIRLPYTTPSVGSECPIEGLIRYNSTVDAVEIYSNQSWRRFRMTDEVQMPIKDTFYGDDSNRVFGPMTYSYSEGQELLIFVYIQNVWQNPSVNYLVNQRYIIFTSPPPDGHTVVVLHGVA